MTNKTLQIILAQASFQSQPQIEEKALLLNTNRGFGGCHELYTMNLFYFALFDWVRVSKYKICEDIENAEIFQPPGAFGKK